MYGLMIESIIEVIKLKFGDDTWQTVRKAARIEQEFFNTHQQYSEATIQKILRSTTQITKKSIDDLMEIFGGEFINFIGQFGYERILRILGRSLKDFLNGLDNLHEYMRYSYPKLRPPSFFVEKETPNGLILHYRTARRGFNYYVVGLMKQIGRTFYKVDIEMKIISEKVEVDMSHVTYQLDFKNRQYSKIEGSSSSTGTQKSAKCREICKPIKSGIFFDLFPFYIIFNRELEIVSLGESLKQAIKTSVIGESIKDVFTVSRPRIVFTWDDIMTHTNNVFELATIEPVVRTDGKFLSQDCSNGFDNDGNASVRDDSLKLRGQMVFVKELESLVYLATPVIESLDTLFHSGLYINDLSMHDASREYVLVGSGQSSNLKNALSQEKQKSKALEDNMKQLDDEIKKADNLLYRMLPKTVADRFRRGEPTINMCEVYSSVTILFSDVVGFTQTCSKLTPLEVVSFLNEMYTKFDKALENHNVYKVETIGDAYMIASGAPERISDHAMEIMDMAFDMLALINTLRNPATGETMMIRIGCHTGSLVSGVVGLRMPRYCLFGETVNTANRMEATGEPMRIHISQVTKQFLPEKTFKISERGILEIAGKPSLKTYLIVGKYDKSGKLENFSYMNENTPEILNKDKKHNPKWEGFKLV